MLSTVLRWTGLMAVITLTISGNFLVCLAVCTSRRLRRVSNCFVVSLAVTDLMLGLLVLPISATLELHGGRWPLGGAFCKLYLSVDVMLGTASILTLLAISVDRYLVISEPLSYAKRFTPGRAAGAIVVIWVISICVAVTPIHMGWNTADFKVQHRDWTAEDKGAEEERTCRYEWHNNYVLLAMFCVFFLPLLVMCGMYHRIFCMAREQVRRIRATTPSFLRSSSIVVTLKEHKATVTLAAVLGVFIICWLPCILYITCMGLMHKAELSPFVYSIVVWLGYFNSVLNPILYPALNRDFRRAYTQLLCCKSSKRVQTAFRRT